VSRAVRVAAVAALLAGAAAAWTWWNGAERQIRRTLDGLADGLSHDAPASPLAAVAAVAGMQQYLAEDVVVEAGGRFQAISGRSAVLSAAARVRSAVPAIRVEFVDLRVTVGQEGTSASVEGTASVEITDRAGQRRTDAREVVVEMRTEEGRWVVQRARTVDVLEPVA
jgi:hypothetical protein